jgi:hypothetical protein
MTRARRHVVARSARAAAAAALCAACWACSRETGAEPTSERVFEQSRSVASDVLSVSVHVSSTGITVADRLTVLFEASRADGGAPPWPGELLELAEGAPFGVAEPAGAAGDGPAAAPWTVVAVRRQTVSPGHELLTLTLEPYLAGDKSIPALRFGEGRGSVQTEPIAVHVASVADGGADGSAGGAARDPLAAIENLGPMLPPTAIDTPLWRGPLVVGVAGGAAALLVLGLGGAWAVRRVMHRSPTPDAVFRRTMQQIRERAGAPDADPAQSVEQTLGALRAYLVARRLLAPGATGPELADALRGLGRAGLLGGDAAQLADVLGALEAARFGPGGAPSAESAASIIDIACRIATADDRSRNSAVGARESGGAA